MIVSLSYIHIFNSPTLHAHTYRKEHVEGGSDLMNFPLPLEPRGSILFVQNFRSPGAYFFCRFR